MPSLNFLDDEARYRVKKIRVYVKARPLGIWRAMAYVYWSTAWSHLWRGGLCGYLMLCTPLAWLAPAVGVSVFALSSLQTIGQALAGYWQSERLAHIARVYGQWFDVTLLLIVAGVACTIQIAQYLHVGERLASAMPFLLAGSLRTGDTREFRETLRCGTVWKIEENATLYRITMGELVWETAKDNEFNRLVFALLLYAARTSSGRQTVVPVHKLVKVLGWDTPWQVQNLYAHYLRTGNWSTVFAHGSSSYLGKIKLTTS